MGDLGQPLNTFWELARRRHGSWSVVTPPDVATNGGLAASLDARGTIAAAVLSSQDLAFSPLALSSDLGTTWLPETLDRLVAKTPSALSVTSLGALAITVSPHEQVLSGTPSLAHWTLLAAGTALASVLRPRCALRSVTAVALVGASTPLVGGACGPGGTGPALVALRGGAWHPVGPKLSGPHDSVVLRLVAMPTGVEALVERVNGGHVDVDLLASGRDLTSWTVEPLATAVEGSVVATGLSTSGAAALVIRSNTGALSTVVVDAGHRAVVTVALPPGTQVVVPGPGLQVQALGVHRSVLDVYARSGRSFRLVQHLDVPIPYGSSD